MMYFPNAFAASLLAAIAIFASAGCNDSSVAESTARDEVAQATSTGPVDRVRAGRPERKTLTLFTSQPGRVEAFEETPLHPKIAGYVEDVYVDIGDAVTKGQRLIQLSIPEMHDERDQKEALVAQAQAEVQQAKAVVQAAEARINTAQAYVNQAEAGISRAEAEYARWQSEYERIRDLAAKGSVTSKLADETLNQFRASEASRAESIAHVESAKASLREAQANAVKAEADLAAVQAKFKVAQANLKQTQTLLAYSEIKAPFDGVVTHRGVDTGHFVQPASGPSSRPLVVVVRTDKVRVFVDVPETEAPLVNAGDQAVIGVQSLRNRRFDAEVTRTSWSLDPSNRSLRTEIDIDNGNELLRPGMYATVTIRLDEQPDALTLPVNAVVKNSDGTFCCCVDGGRIARKPIELGLRSGEFIQVVSGLTGDENVVLTRADALSEGQQVEVVEAGK